MHLSHFYRQVKPNYGIFASLSLKSIKNNTLLLTEFQNITQIKLHKLQTKNKGWITKSTHNQILPQKDNRLFLICKKKIPQLFFFFFFLSITYSQTHCLLHCCCCHFLLGRGETFLFSCNCFTIFLCMRHNEFVL